MELLHGVVQMYLPRTGFTYYKNGHCRQTAIVNLEAILINFSLNIIN